MDSYERFYNATFIWNRKMLTIMGHDIYDKNFKPHTLTFIVYAFAAVLIFFSIYTFCCYDNFVRFNEVLYLSLSVQVKFTCKMIKSIKRVNFKQSHHIHRAYLKFTIVVIIWIFCGWLHTLNSFLNRTSRQNPRSAFCYFNNFRFTRIWSWNVAVWCTWEHHFFVFFTRCTCTLWKTKECQFFSFSFLASMRPHLKASISSHAFNLWQHLLQQWECAVAMFFIRWSYRIHRLWLD